MAAPLSRRARAELSAGLLTAVIHVVPLERFYPEILEIIVVIGAWVGYLAFTLVKDRAEARAMGWTTQNSLRTVGAATAVFAIGTAFAALIAWREGRLALDAHMIPLALLYPFWGLVQQWLMLGIVARRIDEWRPRAKAVTVLVTALVFGAVHYPEWPLMLGTFALGLALTPIYLRWRNLWPLGLVHGWLAIPVYFWVLGKDPWLDVTAG